MTKKRKIIASIIAVLAVMIIAIVVFMYNQPLRYKNINAVQQSVSFTVLLPTTLPKGATIANQPTYQSKDKIVLTTISLKNGNITLSQQKRPQIDLKQLDAQETYLVEAGSVYILKGEDKRLQAIVETSDSWIMVNAPDSISLEQFKELLNSLGRV